MKFIFALSLLLMLALSAMSDELRLALFPLDDESKPLAELALAELSGEPEVTFLERSELDRIKSELQMNAALGDCTLTPDMLQNAELFVAIHNGAVQAFDGITGVRLLDTSVESAEETVAAVRVAIKKQRDFTGGTLRRISCMALVPANLSKAQNERAQQLEAILLRKLASLPDIALLERRHLLLLLNEPNATENKLTSQLFAGAVVIKAIATPAKDEGIKLTIEFYTPDGQQLIGTEEELFPTDVELAKSAEAFLKRLKLPALPATDKAGEARNFIYEAWFAARHSLYDGALTSAASAAALNPEYETELCRLAAITAMNSLCGSYDVTPAAIQSGLLNLKVALDLAECLHIFPLELEIALREFHRSCNPRNFQKRFKGREDEVRTLVERGLERFRESRKETLARATIPCETSLHRLLALEAQAFYLRDLTGFACICWEDTYWDRLVYPEIEDFIKKLDLLLPELQEYFALSSTEKYNLLQAKEIKERREPNARHWLDIQLNLESIANHCTKVRTISPETIESHRRTAQLLCGCNEIILSLTGSYQMFLFEINARSIIEANNRHLDIAQPLARFISGIEELIRTKEHIRVTSTMETYSLDERIHSMLNGADIPLERKIQMHELAYDMLGINNLWLRTITEGYQEWSKETAMMVYAKLLEWEKRNVKYTPSDYFRLAKRNLEEKFNLTEEIVSNDSQEVAKKKIADFKFKSIVQPFKNMSIGHNTILGFENDNTYFKDGSIYMVVANRSQHGPQYTDVIGIEPDTGNFTMILHYYAINYGSICGWTGKGGIADKSRIAWDGYLMHIFSKDPNKPCETVDFSQYCKNHGNPTALQAAEVTCDRAFMLFQGYYNSNLPTNILEYNLETKETKVIASTIDRTVKWPLQGSERPVTISSLVLDKANNRILVLLPDKDYDSHTNAYAVRLWAYYWDTERWEVISQMLPLREDHIGNSIFIDDQGLLWLATHNGFGPINSDGVWQPVFVLGSYDKMDVKMPNFTNGFNKVPIDYSNIIKPDPKYDDIRMNDIYFYAYVNGYFFSSSYAYDIKARELRRLPQKISPRRGLGGHYLLASPYNNTAAKELMIIKI